MAELRGGDRARSVVRRRIGDAGLRWLAFGAYDGARCGVRPRWGFGQGFVAGTNGPPFGVGAALVLCAFTLCLARGLSRLGLFSGNVTIATIVVTIAALLIVFIFYPVGSALVAAVLDAGGRFAPGSRRRNACSPRTSGDSGVWAAAPVAALRSIPRCSRRSSACYRRCWDSCWRWSCSAAASATRACSRSCRFCRSSRRRSSSRWRWWCCSGVPDLSPAGSTHCSASRARAGSTACPAWHSRSS